MTRDVPPPYDGDAYLPTGALTATERAFADRLYNPLHAILSWRLVDRDSAGHLIAAAILPAGTRHSAHVGTRPPLLPHADARGHRLPHAAGHHPHARADARRTLSAVSDRSRSS